MHEQLARAHSGMVGIAAVFVGADMAVEQPKLPILDEPVGVLQVDPTRSDGLHLGTR